MLLRQHFGHRINDSQLNRANSVLKSGIFGSRFSLLGRLPRFTGETRCTDLSSTAQSMPRFLIAFIGLSICAHSAPPSAAIGAGSGLNAVVLEAIRTMPREGGYSTTPITGQLLSEAIKVGPRGLGIDAERAAPSYCASATYLVFLTVYERLLREGQLTLEASALESLRVAPGQIDGEGIWGRWNANGPGTARLFHELQLGQNFTDWSQARPGDFMKIFWNTEIGKRERGHSVIYLGTEREGGVEYVRFWSSNKPRGYGEKRVTRKSVAFAIFSRLEHPENLSRGPAIPKRDAYLASLLTVPSSQAEVREKCGM
jgi:hypothetical protein